MLEEEKIEHIIEIVIQMVRAEPIIYDKSEDDYKSKVERRGRFHVISQALYQYYEEDWPAQEVETLWDNLCMKYKELQRQEKKGCASGSAAQPNPQDVWPFYQSMQFLNPYIEHNETLSSNSTPTLPDTDNNKSSRFTKRNTENVNRSIEERILDITEKYVENDDTITKNAQDLENEEKERRIANFMPLIKRSLQDISEENKKECIIQIMCMAKQFK